MAQENIISRNRTRFFLAALFLISIGLLFLLSSALIDDFINTSQSQTFMTSGQSSSVNIEVQLLSLVTENDVEKLTLRIDPGLLSGYFGPLWQDHLARYNDSQRVVSSKCLFFINVENFSHGTQFGHPSSEFQGIAEEFSCNEPFDVYDPSSQTVTLELLDTAPATALFPLDTREIDLSFQAFTIISSESGDLGEATFAYESPNVTLSNFLNHWKGNVSFRKNDLIAGTLITESTLLEPHLTNSTEANIILKRPLSIRVLSFSLFISLAVFIAFLLLVPDSSSALEAAVGILFGLWSVHEFLIPDTIQQQTLVDFLILLLYLLFGMAVVVRFVYRPVDNFLKSRAAPSPTVDNQDPPIFIATQEQQAFVEMPVTTRRYLIWPSIVIGIIGFLAFLYSWLRTIRRETA
jgi:hypothetical protein